MTTLRQLIHLKPAPDAPLLAYSVCGLDSASVVAGARRSADISLVTCPTCLARHNMQQPMVKVERWEGNEYIVVVSGLGPVGQPRSKSECELIAKWLCTALRDLAALPPLPDEIVG